MTDQPAHPSRPTRWLSFSAIIALGIAILVASQDLTGALWHTTTAIKPADFREQKANAFRLPIRITHFWIPPRFQSSTIVLEKDRILTKQSTHVNVIDRPAGRYAWTNNNLWISPISGLTQDLAIRSAVLVPWWLRLVSYGTAALLVLAVLRSKEERRLWLLFALSTEQGLLRGLHQREPANSLSVTIVILLAGAAVMLNAGFNKPIWMDEFLHFCLGSYDSTRAAWGVVSKSLVEVNHGQTGVYMMLDYWLLKYFGASALALRLPSLLSAFFLLLASAAVLRFRGFGFFWQCLVILALFAQSHVMNFAAEARPYMPFTAATVGILAYYLAPGAMRRRWWVALGGWGSVLLGSLMHPYFALYWLATFSFAHGVALFEGTLKWGFKSLLAHVNLPMSLTGALVFFYIGSLSWLRGGPSFTFDPFEWIKREDLWSTVVDGTHLEFISYHSVRIACLFMAAALPLTYFLLPERRQRQLQPLVAPAVLLLLAFALTAIISYLSYRRDYWILSRQWIASIALAAIACVWLSGELVRCLIRWRNFYGTAAICLWLLSLFAPAKTAFFNDWVALDSHLKTKSAPTPMKEPDPAHGPVVISPETLVLMANQNIQEGGPVWPYFRVYYGQSEQKDAQAKPSMAE